MLWTQVEQEPVLKVRSLCLEAMALLQVVRYPTSSSCSSSTVATLHEVGSSVVRVLALSPGVSSVDSDVITLQRNLSVMRKLLEQAQGIEAQAAALCCLGRGLGSALAKALGLSHEGSEEAGGMNRIVSQTLDGECEGMKEGLSSETLQTVSRLQPHLEVFVRDLAVYIRPDQPEHLRMAALESLSASRLLDVHPSLMLSLASGHSGSTGREGEVKDQAAVTYGAVVSLSVWMSILQLLEDEDLDLRSRAAAVAQSSLQHLYSRHGAAHNDDSIAHYAVTQQLAGAGLEIGEIPGGGFVEVVLRQVLSLLHRMMGCCGGQEALQLMVLDPSEELPGDLKPSTVRTVRK
jgi:hypothetical protein